MPTVEEVTGTPARTFAVWARDHAHDFRGFGLHAARRRLA
jgi:hypothetical protein